MDNAVEKVGMPWGLVMTTRPPQGLPPALPKTFKQLTHMAKCANQTTHAYMKSGEHGMGKTPLTPRRLRRHAAEAARRLV